MSTARRRDASSRRFQLVEAARAAFADKGVALTTVSDIVKRAGVAQGTFYLYFASKSAVVNAVAEQLVDEMVDEAGRRVADTRGAVERLLALRDVLSGAAVSSAGPGLVEAYHRPENREVHHGMAERIAPRLAALVESIVRDGVAEGVFRTEDPRAASWFVLGGLQAHELMDTPPDEVAPVLAEMTALALRALGCAGATPTSPSTP